MIAGNAGLALYLWALFGLATVITVIGISLFSTVILRRLEHYSPAARRRFLWCLAGAPLFVGGVAVIVTLLPTMSHELGWALDHCHAHSNEHGHFCWYHPATFHVVSGLGLMALVSFLFLSLHAVSMARKLWRHTLDTRTLMAFATLGADGVYRLESDVPGAFTAGFFRPRKLITQGLEQALTPVELNVVQLHESVHAARRDPLQVFLFKLFMQLFPRSVRIRLNVMFDVAVEQDADSYVAGQLQDRLIIATTLIKVRRFAAQVSPQPWARTSCHFGTDALEQRICLLLDEKYYRPFPARIVMTAIAMLTAAGGYYAETLHHYIEYFLSH